MAMAHSIHGHGPVAIAPLNPWRMPWRMAYAHPREDFAWIDRFRVSKFTGVKGRSGGSLPSIGAIIEHQDF